MRQGRGRLMVAAVGLGLMGLAAQAGAQNNCDRGSGGYDATYCLMKVYVQADNDLNTAYGRLRLQLNAAGREKLRLLELAWIRQRNRDCVGSSDRGRLLYMDCAVQMTVDRANFLNDRSRECLSSGCRVSALR